MRDCPKFFLPCGTSNLQRKVRGGMESLVSPVQKGMDKGTALFSRRTIKAPWGPTFFKDADDGRQSWFGREKRRPPWRPPLLKQRAHGIRALAMAGLLKTEYGTCLKDVKTDPQERASTSTGTAATPVRPSLSARTKSGYLKLCPRGKGNPAGDGFLSQAKNAHYISRPKGNADAMRDGTEKESAEGRCRRVPFPLERILCAC